MLPLEAVFPAEDAAPECLAVDFEPRPLAHRRDEVLVDGASLPDSPSGRQASYARPSSEVDRIAHLLVEQDIVRKAVDAAVHPDTEFTQLAGAAVGPDDFVDDCLARSADQSTTTPSSNVSSTFLTRRPGIVIGTSKVTTPSVSCGAVNTSPEGRLCES